MKTIFTHLSSSTVNDRSDKWAFVQPHKIFGEKKFGDDPEDRKKKLNAIVGEILPSNVRRPFHLQSISST